VAPYKASLIYSLALSKTLLKLQDLEHVTYLACFVCISY